MFGHYSSRIMNRGENDHLCLYKSSKNGGIRMLSRKLFGLQLVHPSICPSLHLPSPIAVHSTKSEFKLFLCINDMFQRASSNTLE